MEVEMAITRCTSPNCTSEIKNSQQACVDPEVSYQGAVLALTERNGYDDSDFLAIVWDDQAGAIKHVEYGTTRFWSYHNHAKIDATPDVIAKAQAALAATLVESMTEKATIEAHTPRKGTRVRSLTTRGKNKGLEGEVAWYGKDSYRSNQWNTYMKVGVKVEGEEKLRYLDAERVEVIDPQPIDADEIAQYALDRAESKVSMRDWSVR